MSDLRDRLERESRRVMLPPDAHARLLERRQRRERNRRVVALGVGLALTAGIVIFTVQGARFVGDRSRPAATPHDRFYEEIAGTYTTVLSRKDPGVSRFGLEGRYTMRLRPSGVLLVSVPPGFELQGTSSILFRISGNLFSTNAFANFDCRNTIGTYRWSSKAANWSSSLPTSRVKLGRFSSPLDRGESGRAAKRSALR